MYEFIQILIKNIPKGIVPGSMVIVFKRNDQRIEFLVIKALPSKSIGFPSGKISWGENYEQAAKRELHEETGIKADKLKILPFIHKFRYDHIPFRPRCDQRVFLYEIDKLDKTKLYSKETEWFKWLTKDKVLKTLSHKELIDSFKLSLKYIY